MHHIFALPTQIDHEAEGGLLTIKLGLDELEVSAKVRDVTLGFPRS